MIFQIYIDTKKYFSNSNKNLSSFLKNEGIDISNVDSLKLLYNYGEDKEFISKIERIKFDNKKLLLQKLNLSNINPYSIFDMNLAIFHENKRQLLKALQIAWLYYALKDNVNIKLAPITFFFAGKANADYYMAKEIIKFINHLKDMINKDTLVKDKLKIVFVEDYNLNKARNLLKASDVFNNLTLSIYDNSSFEILNACFNFSNIISSRSGIIKNIKKKNAIYTFADTVEEVYEIKNKNLYNALETYYQNPLKDVVDNLINERNKNFNYDFKIIYKQLLKYNDSFFIFKDLYELIKVGLRVSDDYLNSKKWVSNEIENFVWANEYNLENNFIDKIRH
ncbi:MAG: glycogen/starch/alpha-glucan phosphorylase [Tissierellia bacterium]|nr:glycogen/starch/alpha-glucan phosphorylase [Tissierellia bacterium]